MLQFRRRRAGHMATGQHNAFSTTPRRSERMQMQSFATVTLDHEKEAILLDLSETGLRLQSTQTWQPGSEIYMSFFLPNSFTLVEGTATVVWSDITGRAGVKFADPEMQSMVTDWIEQSTARKKSVHSVRVR